MTEISTSRAMRHARQATGIMQVAREAMDDLNLPDAIKLGALTAEIAYLAARQGRLGDAAAVEAFLERNRAAMTVAIKMAAGQRKAGPLEFDEASPGGICHMGHDWRVEPQSIDTVARVCVRCGERSCG